MTHTPPTTHTPPKTVSLTAAPRPRDVQVKSIGPNSQVLRSRTWDRLKFEVEYGRRQGTTANSYLIQGDRSALIDPPGGSFTTLFLEALEQEMELSSLDYIIVQHLNGNRMVTLEALRALAPQAQLLCSRPAAKMLANSPMDWSKVLRPLHGNNPLDLGQGHQLQFLTWPTPRWPDGLGTYDPATQTLYSDKLFGAHLCSDSLWDENWRQLEADRRHYFDCLQAPQARQVERALKQLDSLPLRILAPGHGPVVRHSLSRLRQDYQQWCQQETERSLRVAMLYTSAYGNTAKLAHGIAQGLIDANIAVETLNCEFVPPENVAKIVAACDGFIIGSPTLGGHAPAQIQTALGCILANVPKTKLAGIFGSYGWSGEAIDLLKQKLLDGGFRLGFSPLRVKFAPDEETLQRCHEIGSEFAKQLSRRSKRRTQRRTVVNHAPSDRTAQALGRIVGSLGVITVQQGEEPLGLLTSWISQATFDPPGIMLALPIADPLLHNLQSGMSFVLNILKEGRTVRRHFPHHRSIRLDMTQLATLVGEEQGGIVLADALAALTCTVQAQLSAGDHRLIYASVERGQLLEELGMAAIEHHQPMGAGTVSSG